METLSTILQQFGKAGNIAALFSSTFGLFAFIDNMSSTQARADFSKYLKSTDFTGSAVHLPDDTRSLFERVFGARHFSLQCVIASVLFSIISLIFLFGLAILNNFETYLSLDRGFRQNPVLLSMTGAWVIWSLVPDYFNLLKTRKILGIITARQIRRTSVLVVILFADFVVGYVFLALRFSPSKYSPAG